VNRVVVDAGIGIAVLLPLPDSGEAHRLFHKWITRDVERWAPVLWEYEVVSVVRKYVAAGQLSDAQADAALEALAGLGVRTVPPDHGLHVRTLRWAAALKQVVAYDAAYLALAEHLDAEFWTTDRRLAQRARELQITWVRRPGDTAAPAE